MSDQAYILYIEDERPTLNLVCQMLKLGGYEAAGTTSGQEGLVMMRQRPPDLVLLDLNKNNNSVSDDDDLVYSNIVYSSGTDNVKFVMIDGKWVVKESKSLVNDNNKLKSDSGAELKKLLRRL